MPQTLQILTHILPFIMILDLITGI